MNECVCFFGLRHCGRRRRAFFSYECIVFWGPELFFQWEALFFRFRPIENGFSMSIFVFLVPALLKIDFSMRVYVFWSQAYKKMFLNESVCFFGVRHCGRRAVRFFWFEFIMFLGHELFFSMKVFVFLVAMLLNIHFSMRVLVFLSKAY